MRKHFLLLFLLCLCMAFGALADTGTAICMEKFMQNANADGTPKILYTGVAKFSMSMRRILNSLRVSSTARPS